MYKCKKTFLHFYCWNIVKDLSGTSDLRYNTYVQCNWPSPHIGCLLSKNKSSLYIYLILCLLYKNTFFVFVRTKLSCMNRWMSEFEMNDSRPNKKHFCQANLSLSSSSRSVKQSIGKNHRQNWTYQLYHTFAWRTFAKWLHKVPSGRKCANFCTHWSVPLILTLLCKKNLFQVKFNSR